MAKSNLRKKIESFDSGDWALILAGILIVLHWGLHWI
jgi:hypothetical protein